MTESLYRVVLPVRQGEGQGLSSSWILIGPGQAKVGLWVYGCHWTVRYTDRDGGVTEGKTTKNSKNGGMEGQTSTIHAENRETDDMVKVGEMAAMDRKKRN